MLEKFSNFINWLTHQKKEPCESPLHKCGLYAEMEKIQQNLSRVETKPIRIAKPKVKPVIGPVTERQRLMDLAG